MKLTPLEIKTKTFTSKLRGCNVKEVTSFLESVASEWDELLKQDAELKKKVVELETRLNDYTSMEKAIQQTFMQAQETSGKAIENTRKEAQLIIHEAELKATQILEKARADLTTMKEQHTILKVKRDSLVTRLKMLLNSELDLIKALEIDEELQTKDKMAAQHEISHEKTEIEDIIKNLD